MNDTELLSFILDLDKSLIEQGLPIRKRQHELTIKAMKKMGVLSWSFGSERHHRVKQAIATIYDDKWLDNKQPSGSFLYRDVFATIYVPAVFGTVRIDPFDFVDLTNKQKDICFSDALVSNWYIDQFFDLWDVDQARSEVWGKASHSLDAGFMSGALSQLTGSSSVANSGAQFIAAVQSSVLAMELSLKAAHAKLGMSEKEIKDQYGHKLTDLLRGLETDYPNLDHARLQRVAANAPDYAKSRYPGFEITTTSFGHLLMGAQYFVSEIIRSLYPISSRKYNIKSSTQIKRAYPPI